MERYSVPTTITAISTVLDSLQGRKILVIEEVPMAGWLYRNDAPKKFEKLLSLSHRLLAQQILADVSKLRYQSCPGKELAATLNDMESMAYLGRYYADKMRGAADLDVFQADKNRRENRQNAVHHFTNAVEEWESYARITTSQYKP